MHLDVNKLTAQLERELYARIAPHLTQDVKVSDPNRLTGVTQQSNSSDKSDFKQSLTSLLEDKEVILLKLLGEFTKKDEGKVLASELGKFARYVQSEVMKASNVDKEISSS